MFARHIPLLAMATALGAILAANVFAQTTTCQSTFTVVEGDTCNEIAIETNVTLAALLAANPAIDAACDNLFIGQQLCIPGATPPPPPPVSNCTANFTVQSGDVCISIANMFNITAAQLEAANSQINVNCTNLQPGEILCIPVEN